MNIKDHFILQKKHQLRYYLFLIFTKEDEMARGLNNFNPKEYIISIETNLDKEGYLNLNSVGSRLWDISKDEWNELYDMLRWFNDTLKPANQRFVLNPVSISI